MSFSNDLNLSKKNSDRSENSLNYLFENANIKKNDSIKEEDSDSDDFEKKFGSQKDNNKKIKKNNKESSEEDDNGNFQLNIKEDNSTENFSIGKYLDKNTKKKQGGKIGKKK